MPKFSYLVLATIISLLVHLCIPTGTRAQSAETIVSIPDSVMEKRHSPQKATIMSTLLPGLGQVYNKKYWKVPVIYAGFGLMAYFIVTNTSEYINYKCAYIEKMNGNTHGSYADLVNKYSAENLLSAREYYRRNTEISILITTIWYVLNIVDASVDAHLFTYNISKDLTFKWEPTLLPTPVNKNFSSGIRLSIHF